MSRFHKPKRALAIALMSLAFASPALASRIAPVEIMPEADECAHCRMSVHKDRFSSELLLTNGDVKKFDEIGCMVNYTRRAKLDSKAIKAIFFLDFTSGNWLSQSEAVLVKSRYPTPMRAGILAFPSESAAKQLDAKYQGRITSWDALVKER